MATRINLSIPNELKERMDRMNDVNWSKVAQETFEMKVQINELKGNDMAETAGIERLRASKKTNTEREEAEGIVLGKQWALESASYDELVKVAAMFGAEPNADTLASACGYDDTYQCMHTLFDDSEPSCGLLEGFIKGATEVFRKV